MTKRFDKYVYFLAFIFIFVANSFAMESATPGDQSAELVPVRGNKFDLKLFTTLKLLAITNDFPNEIFNDIIIKVLALLIKDAKLNGNYVLEREFIDNFRNTVAFSPDGRLVAASGKILSVEDGTLIHTFKEANPCGYWNIHLFSPSGKLFAASDYLRECILIWNIEDGNLLWKFKSNGGEGSIYSCAFSPKNDLVAIGDRENILLGDLNKGELKEIFIGFHALVSSLTFSPDGSSLAFWTNGCIRLCHIASESIKPLPSGYYHGAHLVFSPCGKYLTAINGLLTTWDIEQGIELNSRREKVKNLKHCSGIPTFALSRDHEYIAAGSCSFDFSNKHPLEIWSKDSDKRLCVLAEDCQRMHAIAFSEFGIASTEISGSLKIWVLWPLAKGFVSRKYDTVLDANSGN